MTVTVTDKDNASGTQTMVVTVNNVAPSFNGLGGPSTIGEGQTFSRTNQQFNDPGANDAWTGTVDYGDGSGVQALTFTSIRTTNFSRGTFNLSHLYVDNGVFTVTVVVTDKDGGSTTANNTFQVAVNNQTPGANVNFNFGALEDGTPVTVGGTFFDAGANDAPWSGTVDFGDGTGQQALTMNPGVIPPGSPQNTRGTFSTPGHTYAHAGNYMWVFRITDKDGSTGVSQFNIHVDARLVSIVVTPNPATLHAIGATLQFTGVATFSDGSTSSTANIPPGDPEAPTWFSTNPAVATVDAQGRASAVGLGVTTIGVAGNGDSCADFSGCATLTVSDNTPPSVGTAANVATEATGPTTAVTFTLPSATDDFDPHPAISADHASGGLFPVGITTIAVTATDAAGNTAHASFTVTVRDTASPTLTLPTNVTVDATSPAGAIVTYTASATDSVSGALTVTCTPPSGNMFPIGASTVNCTASDGAGNTVGGSFQVLVQAAAAQVTNLTLAVQSFNLAQGVENSLDTKLQNVLSALNAAKSGNAGSVCNQMGAFINDTMAQSGKQLTAAQANQLIAAAQQIEAVIGCQ